MLFVVLLLSFRCYCVGFLIVCVLFCFVFLFCFFWVFFFCFGGGGSCSLDILLR